jgi:hypothetical protein
MKTLVSPVVAAAVFVFTAAPVMAGGGHQPRIHQPGVHAQDTRTSGSGGGNGSQAGAPAGMPSFYQPSYSIERKDWWQPHPYFQSNGQGFGYPTRPVARPYAGYGTQGR